MSARPWLAAILCLGFAWAEPPAVLERAARGAQDDAPADRIGKKFQDLLDLELQKAKPAPPAKALPPRTEAPSRLDAALEKIASRTLREMVGTIAGDDYEGRCAGYPGNDKTCEYFAGIYSRAGLAPVGDKDASGRPGYNQAFSIRGRKTMNTVALLAGSDPKLKNEFVILGGHHDHLGKGNQGPILQRLGGKVGDDDVFSGADDNASGSSTVVQIARAFAEAGLAPRRSILFMTFSGEEWGLLGSAHYVKNPLFPLEGTVAMLNVDMIGRNPTRPVDVRGLGSDSSGLFEKLVSRAASRVDVPVKLYREHTVMGGDSDHSNFRARGIPVMFFFTGLHSDYHRVTDKPDKLDYDRMEKIARMIALILWDLANQDARARFGATGDGQGPLDLFRWPDDPPQAGPRRLGIRARTSFTPEEMDALGLGKEEGGISIEDVAPRSVADQAGLRAGDVIVSIDSHKLPRPLSRALQKLRDALAADPDRSRFALVVLREGKPMELTAQFPK